MYTGDGALRGILEFSLVQVAFPIDSFCHVSQNLVNFSCLSHFTKLSISFPLTFYLFVFILLVTQFLCNLNSSCGFPDSSVGKESACNAGGPGLIPGSGRSPGEGIGYPLHYSWASLLVQLVKNPPAMQETWVHSPGWEDPLEKGKATHYSILAWKIPWTV